MLDNPNLLDFLDTDAASSIFEEKEDHLAND